jgi:hypothetical protein
MRADAVRGRPGMKLAAARISFNYFISERVFDYIVEAVHLIANEGWKLLPRYRFDVTTGLWEHAKAPQAAEPSLAGLESADPLPTASEGALSAQLAEARQIMAAAALPPQTRPPRRQRFDRLRWFPLPDEGSDPGARRDAAVSRGREKLPPACGSACRAYVPRRHLPRSRRR